MESANSSLPQENVTERKNGSRNEQRRKDHVIPVVPGAVRQSHPANEKDHQKKGNLPGSPEEHFDPSVRKREWARESASKQVFPCVSVEP
jgi:hypothetical protein